jgi:ABC-2 type transport system ATP-binding protein
VFKPAIETVGLQREFGGGLKAVQGIDLAVAPGEVYGFLGPNGAGKTTTVRMLVTLLRPTGGRATIAGFDVATQPAEVRRRIGVALQEAALDLLMTGRELMELQATLHGIPRRTVAPRAAELIERVGLSQAAERRVATYSGGMRRRLDLAMALIHEPEVLFLDEPTTGLDPHRARRCGTRCAGCATRAPRSSSPRSTSKRPISWPTGSGSSTTGGWSPRARRRR